MSQSRRVSGKTNSAATPARETASPIRPSRFSSIERGGRWIWARCATGMSSMAGPPRRPPETVLRGLAPADGEGGCGEAMAAATVGLECIARRQHTVKILSGSKGSGPCHGHNGVSFRPLLNAFRASNRWCEWQSWAVVPAVHAPPKFWPGPASKHGSSSASSITQSHVVGLFHYAWSVSSTCQIPLLTARCGI